MKKYKWTNADDNFLRKNGFTRVLDKDSNYYTKNTGDLFIAVSLVEHGETLRKHYLVFIRVLSDFENIREHVCLTIEEVKMFIEKSLAEEKSKVNLSGKFITIDGITYKLQKV
jgi:hypothetical protein